MEEEALNEITVMIVGAGLGGVLLAILLERLDISYCIFERAHSVKTLGSAMSMNANIMPVFEQLGLLEEIKKISKPCESIKLHDIHMKELVEFAMSSYQDLTGYQPVVFARPRLYNLLISQIPSHKILRGKKVLSFEENEDHVLISCSDNSQYRGDILVGADGAYSGVRQCLFKKLEREGSLPRSDTQGMTIGYVCTVGTTESIDPEKYPCLRDNATRFSQVLGKDLFNYTTATVPDNQICWALVMQHKKEGEGKELAFRNSEWAPESVETSLKDFYNFPCPFGGSMKDIIDATPKECISKVFLEEKIMETWYHGRVVLIGDACHKMLPAAGQGAVNAMQDAVVLANCLYDLRSTKLEDIIASFKEYRDQRYPHARAQFDNSRLVAKLTCGQSVSDRILRHMIFKVLPESVQRRKYMKVASYRPQACFLPLVDNRGQGPVLPQKASWRRQRELEKRERQTALERPTAI